jgi:hypothetical protein
VPEWYKDSPFTPGSRHEGAGQADGTPVEEMQRLAHFLGSGRRKCAIGAFGAFSVVHFRPLGLAFFWAARFGPGAADESYSLEDLGEERVPANRWMAKGIGHLLYLARSPPTRPGPAHLPATNLSSL